MRKAAKIQTLPSLKVFLLAIFLHAGASGFTSMPVIESLSCVIDDLQRSGVSQNTVTYSWSAVSGATVYKVYYVRLSDGFTSTVSTSSSTSYTSPVLTTGVTYRFYFAPVCGNEAPSYVADDIVIN